MNILWKQIPGYGGKYSVSSAGGVKNTKSGRSLRQWSDRSGYMRVALFHEGHGKQFYVHRLVATAFIPRSSSKLEVNHINGDKADNSVSNLEWCTKSENQRHSYRVLGRRWHAGRPRVGVTCIETGESFDSIASAARAKGIDSRNLHAVLSPKSYKKTCGGFHWIKSV